MLAIHENHVVMSLIGFNTSCHRKPTQNSYDINTQRSINLDIFFYINELF